MEQQLILKFDTINGRTLAYSSATVFQVQIGRNSSAYKTRYSFTGNLAQAVAYYRAINIGNGYKKRLVGYGLNKPILARQFSA